MKLRFIVLLLLLSGFMLFTSCSFASMSTDTKNLIYSQCQTLNEKGVISSATLEYINSKLYNSNTFNGSNFGDNYFIFIGKGTRYNGGGHNYSKLSTNNSIYIGCVKTGVSSVINRTSDTSNSFYTNWDNVWGAFRCNVSNKTDYSEGNFGYNDALDGFYIYSTVNINTRLIQLTAGQEYGGQYLLDYGPTFTPNNRGIITVYASNGSSQDMNRLPFSYTGETIWNLGYLSDYDDTYSIFGYFGPLVYTDGQLYTEAYQNEFSYNKYLGTQNGGLVFDSSTGAIGIRREKLINMQGYSLYLSYRSENGSSLEDIGDFYYYAYFWNLGIESGDLVSPDLNSTVDISMLNALDDFFKTDDVEKDNLNYDLNGMFSFSGDFLSGDFFSGDLLANLDYNDYTYNDYSLFVYRVYRSFLNAMSYQYTNSYIQFDIHGHTYTYYASDFTTPDGTLKTFVSGFCICGIVLLIIYQFHYFILCITTLDIIGLVNSWDQDHTIFM